MPILNKTGGKNLCIHGACILLDSTKQTLWNRTYQNYNTSKVTWMENKKESVFSF